MSPRVVLVGPMGAGKSAVGALVATSLGLVLRDADADVEAAAGVPVAEVFAREGEEGFRRREREAVAAALAEHDGVLALGGGAVLDAVTRAALVGHHVVLLDVSWEHAAARIGSGAGRPLLAGSAEERWTAILDARRHLYEEVAVHTVLTDGLTAQQVAARVIQGLSRSTDQNGGVLGRSSNGLRGGSDARSGAPAPCPAAEGRTGAQPDAPASAG